MTQVFLCPVKNRYGPSVPGGNDPTWLAYDPGRMQVIARWRKCPKPISVEQRLGQDCEDHFNVNGIKARRLPRAGSKDLGDVCLHTPDFDIVVECKNVKNLDVAEALRQADVESSNYSLSSAPGKHRRTGDQDPHEGPGEGRVTLTIDKFIMLLR